VLKRATLTILSALTGQVDPFRLKEAKLASFYLRIYNLIRRATLQILISFAQIFLTENSAVGRRFGKENKFSFHSTSTAVRLVDAFQSKKILT